MPSLRVSFRKTDFAPDLLSKIHKALDGVTLRAGFLSGAGGYGADNAGDSGLDMAALGAVHEFGATITTKSGTSITLPERSFLRAAFEANRAKYVQRMHLILKSATAGRDQQGRFLAGSGGSGSALKGFKLLSLEMASDIRAFIRSGQVKPPDSEATIAEKEARRARGNTADVVTLVDSGAMAAAVTGDASQVGKVA
jgi:hypothetical protein